MDYAQLMEAWNLLDDGEHGHTMPRLFPPTLGGRELTPETTAGFSLIEFAELIGQPLRPFQQWLALHGLEYNEDGSDFRFKRVIVEVARQNGKTHFMVVLGLWRLFVFGASGIISTAQNLKYAEGTLADAFRIAAFNPVLSQWLRDNTRADEDDEFNGKYITRVNGGHMFKLTGAPVDGAVDLAKDGPPFWSVTTSTRKGGRSMTVDLAFFDELREHIKWDAWDAITPTVSQRPFGQVWAFSNAGDASSIVLQDLRSQCLEAVNAGLADASNMALFSWSADPALPIDDPRGMLQANPSLGYGAAKLEHLRAEVRSTPNPDGFRTEYLCQWVQSVEPGKILPAMWEPLADTASTIPDDAVIAVGVDVAVDGRAAYIAVAADRGDGVVHVEVVAARPGYSWVVDWLRPRVGSWCDGVVALQVKGSPSQALAPGLADAGFTVRPWQGGDMTRSTLGFFDAIQSGRVVHIDQPVLNEAALAAVERKAGDVFIWDRGKSFGDISPFVACNIAWWAALNPPEKFISAYAADDFEDVVEELEDAPLIDDDDDDGGGLLIV